MKNIRNKVKDNLSLLKQRKETQGLQYKIIYNLTKAVSNTSILIIKSYIQNIHKNK